MSTMRRRKSRSYSLFELGEALKHLFELFEGDATERATHRYTCTELSNVLGDHGIEVTPYRVGLALQALNVMPVQKYSDGCRYVYLTPKCPVGHLPFVNPEFRDT